LTARVCDDDLRQRLHHLETIFPSDHNDLTMSFEPGSLTIIECARAFDWARAGITLDAQPD
jgi:hypothetical protein